MKASELMQALYDSEITVRTGSRRPSIRQVRAGFGDSDRLAWREHSRGCAKLNPSAS
jgi:hypothetical protein